jgi:hypothetical protein
LSGFGFSDSPSASTGSLAYLALSCLGISDRDLDLSVGVPLTA